MADNSIPKGKHIGSARAQFIAVARNVVRSVDEGGSSSAAVAAIKRALNVLDKKTGATNG